MSKTFIVFWFYGVYDLVRERYELNNYMNKYIIVNIIKERYMV